MSCFIKLHTYFEMIIQLNTISSMPIDLDSFLFLYYLTSIIGWSQPRAVTNQFVMSDSIWWFDLSWIDNISFL